ncbi:hypothetical protein SLEP1_g13234 [Rubroshorea leprosula]|uniref:Uncharacterized protein n=1 Tax=Rubroshorea leprosula TaxID=152421 RepID=A0AAV5IJN5_9ROSI|nr:hypothetical protein SLEP1_g13234 [Rubroshorea leprosula]
MKMVNIHLREETAVENLIIESMFVKESVEVSPIEMTLINSKHAQQSVIQDVYTEERTLVAVNNCVESTSLNHGFKHHASMASLHEISNSLIENLPP